MPVEQSAASKTSGTAVLPAEEPNRWRKFWETMTRFERRKVIPGIAFRNTIGVAVPLAIGVLTGSTLSGIAVATGALNVSYSDGADAYVQRARRMLTATVLTTLTVFLGANIGNHHVIAGFTSAAWAFLAGLAVCLGTSAADLGTISLVTLIVYSAQALSGQHAGAAALLALLGALFQTALSLLLWPVNRYEPERRALADFYLELARLAEGPVLSDEPPSVTQAGTEAHQVLAGLGQDHRVESERYRSLLNQGERVQLSLLTLGRLRRRLRRQGEVSDVVPLLETILQISGDLLYAVGLSLSRNESLDLARKDVEKFLTSANQLRARDLTGLSAFVRALIVDGQVQADALAGQFRAILDLAENSTVPGAIAFAKAEAARPASVRLLSNLATLRANLTLRSTACRHGVRLAACVALGYGLGLALDWRRSYWLPMTIAIVLKPDFTATFSRGVLRLAGTFAGLVMATILFHSHPSQLVQVIWVAAFTFALRSVGPANYGVLVVTVTALIVMLVGMTGVSAAQVIAARAINTAAGGVLALVAYALWPTWERTQVREVFARMLDAYRAYFKGIVETYRRQGPTSATHLDSLRMDARLARSNIEASVDRLSTEPGIPPKLLGLYTAMLASSYRLMHALMALDAGLSSSSAVPAREPFTRFAIDVDLTLYLVAAALRGSPYMKNKLPDLREDHTRLAESGDPRTGRYALVNIETDRLTNSLNTFQEQVAKLVSMR